MKEITSVNNEKIKDIVKLSKSASRRREESVFIVEGLRLVAEVPSERLIEIFVEEGFLEKLEAASAGDGNEKKVMRLIDEAEKKDTCFKVNQAVMKKLSDTDSPQGVLAVVSMEKHDIAQLTGESGTRGGVTRVKEPFILIMDRLQDPGNMGTIIRTAEGAGVTGILISSDSVDVYSPKTVRSTMGSIFRMKICVSENLPEDIERLKSKGIVVFGTHLNGKEFYDEDFTGAAAFLIGNEGRGLSDAVAATADRLLRIPMEGKVESLNAGVSAAVVMYEVLRQRR